MAAVFLFLLLLVAATLPPATRDTEGLSEAALRARGVVRGAFHVHTVRSDGGGTRDDVARAAAAAGLDFVIVTDHGDGTRAPDPPAYIDGVLMLDGVEITTSAGHYAAFGLAQAPHPLGGPPHAVVEDVERLGGFGVAAHPDSPKPELRWRDWTVPIGGLELINGDSAWRDESAMTLLRGLAASICRPAPALAGMIERPDALLARVDEGGRRLVALAGADAHARLPLAADEQPAEAAWTVPALSYESSFRVFANIVDLTEPFSGDAGRDAESLGRAIRQGRVVLAMSALARPAGLEFSASTTADAPHVVHPTGSIVPAQTLAFAARASDVIDDGQSLVRLRLVHDGRVVAETDGPALSHRVEAAASAGVWRVEATLADRPDMPWLLSNPIVVVAAGWMPRGPRRPGFPDSVLDLTTGPWSTEAHAASTARVAEGGEGVVFDFVLAGGEPSGQYGAAVRDVSGVASWSHVVLRARAAGPTRLWVQLRGDVSSERWGRSIYLDRHSREVTLALEDFAPMEPGVDGRPAFDQVRSVLVVVDTTNSAPGRAGQVTIERLALEHRQ